MTRENKFKELFDIDGRGLTESDINGIMKWLENSGIDITDEDEINDNHYEPTWDYMFNWIHEDEAPNQVVKKSNNPNDYDNVYVCEDGGCIFFYGIC